MPSPILSSRRSFNLDQPLNGDLPVVVNMKSVFLSSIKATAIGGSGTTHGRWFFVLSLGMVHVLPSISERRMPATSFNLHPVNSSNLSSGPNRGSPSATFQNLTISASVRTLSRVLPGSGGWTDAQGLTSILRWRWRYENIVDSAE